MRRVRSWWMRPRTLKSRGVGCVLWREHLGARWPVAVRHPGIKVPKSLLLLEGVIAGLGAGCAGSGTDLAPAWLFLSENWKQLSIGPCEEPHICVLEQILPLLESQPSKVERGGGQHIVGPWAPRFCRGRAVECLISKRIVPGKAW